MERVPPDPHALLAHADFVRALARTLVRDAARADDLEQETWVAALEHAPRSARAPRGWLLTVLRNFTRRFARGEARRVRREGEAARPEPVPSTLEIVAREEVRRRVVEAVLALDEPHRSAVVLRYYEDLPPRAIARRLGIPVETVRTRLRRGLALLRARLDREWGGNRMAWCAALAPLAVKKAGLAGVLVGGVAMSTKVAVSIAALVGLAVAFWPEARTREPEVARSTGIAPARGVQAQGPIPERDASVPARTPLASTESPPGASPSQAEPSGNLRYRGSVVSGRLRAPVAGARVRLFAIETGEEFASAESGGNGAFDLRGSLDESRAPITLRIEAAKEGLHPWTSSRRTDRVFSLPFEISNVTLTFETPQGFEGRVVEVFGDVPIPGARVFLSTHEFTLGESEPKRVEALFPVATTGPDGRFHGLLPSYLGGMDLLVEAERYLPVCSYWHHQLHKAPNDLTIRLPRAEELPRLKGRVVDAEGRPIQGAAVLLDALPRGVPFVDPVLAAAGKAYWDYRARSREFNKVETDADGRYVHQLFSPGTWSVAAKHGPFLEFRDVGIDEAREVELDFRLAGTPIVWVGTVRSRATGLPIAGARVDVTNRGFKWHGRPTTLETGADGDFRYGPAPFHVVTFEVTAPGHGYGEASFRAELREEEKAVVIQLAPECRLRGRAVDERGEAIPNADVIAYVWPDRILAKSRADPGGAFELGGLPAKNQFTLVAESPGPGYPRSRSVVMMISLESPGEVRDLGTVVLRGK